MSNETEEIKKQALKNAQSLHTQAQNKGDADLYDKAAQYYYTAGRNKEANDCWNAADALRKGEAVA